MFMINKKLLVLITSLISFIAYAASTYTTNYNLNKPADGDSSWGEALRDNLDTIDTELNVNADSISNHIADTVDAHDSTAVSTPGGTICLTADGIDTVEEYLDCLEDQVLAAVPGGGVTISTTQTITGDKTFSITPQFSALTTGVLHADADGDLTSSNIVNADIDAAAAIARSKIASGTASHVIINDGSGNLSSSATLSTTLGGLGADYSASTGLLSIASGTTSAIAVGANGTFLKSNGTVYAAAFESPVVNKTNANSPYTATASDETITVDTSSGAVTINLPAAASLNGKKFIIKKLSSLTDLNLVTIDGNASETIDGATTYVLAFHTESVTIVSNGTNWVVTDTVKPQVAGQARHTTGFASMTSGTNYLVDFNSVASDPYGMMVNEGSGTTAAPSSSAFRINTPKAGTLIVHCNLWLSSGLNWVAGESASWYLDKNGGGVDGQYLFGLYGAEATHTAFIVNTGSGSRAMSAGDYAQIIFVQSSGTNGGTIGTSSNLEWEFIY